MKILDSKKCLIAITSVLFCITSVYNHSYAQYEPTYGIENIRNAVPPSPEASSIGKHIDVPISLYTGIPQIKIPIYTIKEKGIDIPISLDYHAGGVKVEEHAGWVGLGWSLSAGGVITRTIVGGADDGPGGYLSQPYDIENINTLSSTELFNFYSNISTNVIDVEPDIYFFNFLNQSGKFVVNKSTRQGIASQKQNLKIEALNSTTQGDGKIIGWKVTDDQGNNYFFEEVEKTDVKSHTATNRSAYVRQVYTSSWYLSKIILRNNSVITFQYQPHISNYFTKQGSSKFLFLAGGVSTFQCTPPNSDYEKYLEHRITGKHIESISFSNGYIKFIKSSENRQDMPGDYSLKGIEVYHSQNPTAPIKKYGLEYAYFASSAGLNSTSSGLFFNANFQKRLKIERIEEIGAINKSAHVFEYFPGELPSVFSNSQDHWGFYNGSYNSSLVPLDNNGYGSSSVDRGVNFNYAKIGTLSRVNYPTGGYTDFTYESNEASITTSEYNTHFYPYGPVSAQYYESFGAAVYKSPEGNILKDTIYVHPDVETIDIIGNNVTYSVQVNSISNCNGSNRDCIGNLNIMLSCIDCGEVSSQFSLVSCQYNNGSCYGYLKLIPGKSYALSILGGYAFPEVSAGVGGRYYKPPTPNSPTKKNILVGGLRIKRVSSYPSFSPKAIQTDYYYTASVGHTPEYLGPYESSGVLVAFPVYDSYQTYLQRTRSMNGSITIGCLYKFRTSNTRVPLGGMEGTVVGYSNVQTYKTDGSEKIKTISSFYSTADNPDETDYTFPFVILRSNANMRGMLRREIKYVWKNNQFVPVSEIENTYSNRALVSEFSPGLRTGVSVFVPQDMGLGNFISKIYRIPTEFVYLQNSENTLYDQIGVNPLVTTTSYIYDSPSHYNLKRSEVTQSKGHIISTDFKYPHELVATLPFYNEMVNRNIIGPVVEQTQTNVTIGKQLSKTLAEFDFYNGNTLIDMKSVKKSFGATAPETEIIVKEYDSKGNVIEYIDRSGITTTLLWGYQSQYPVAKIINASASVAKTYISQTVLDNPTDDVSLRNHLNALRAISRAFVTTYTYRPLVGISSETDEKNLTVLYQYDDFNRLSIIKDHTGNIVKRICYNLNGQVDICSDAPVRKLTGNTRCKPCAMNSAYITNILQNERVDINPNSASSNQIDWVDVVESTSCDRAAWLTTSTPLRCVKDANNLNTGYVEREENDNNPCSPTFNQLRWVINGLDLAICSVPPACNSSTCTGVNKKCVFGICQTGVLVVDTYELDSRGRCWMYYHYEWSDGSQSGQYSQAAQSSYCN